MSGMNLADAKEKFQMIVAQHAGGRPLGDEARMAVSAELWAVYRHAKHRIDRLTVQPRGRPSHFLSVNERTGLINKLDELHSRARSALGLDSPAAGA